MENGQKEQNENKVVDLSKFDFSEKSSEESHEPHDKRSKSPGSYLSGIAEGLSGSGSSSDKKKIRNIIIIVVNFLLMFIILSHYFGGSGDKEESYEMEAMPAEMMGEENI